jgi:hypothetical protein
MKAVSPARASDGQTKERNNCQETTMQQPLREAVILLMAIAWPVHAQDNLP